VLAEVFRICHTREIEVDHVEMFDARITLVEIVVKFLTFTIPMKGGL
jgi:hypothetical protein